MRETAAAYDRAGSSVKEGVTMGEENTVLFSLAGMTFEYDALKERANIKKHGISFRTAARVFFDDDYIEEYDEAHSDNETRYQVIGDVSAGYAKLFTAIGNAEGFLDGAEDILYVVYTERTKRFSEGKTVEVVRLISARLANSFERGLYYGQYL